MNCIDLKHETKALNSSPDDMCEWNIHQPTWKGIQLPRDGFTSRESEHSQCNGQEKAIQNSKGQLKNVQIILLTSLGILRSNFPPWDSSNSS